MLPAEVYRDLEVQILDGLDGPRERLVYLVEEHDLDVELLSGEWRLLFRATSALLHQIWEPARARARMTVAPEEVPNFVEVLRRPELVEAWEPVRFGLAELADALPDHGDLAGLVFVEESEDWLWQERAFEIFALRRDVFRLLEPFVRELVEARNFAALARLAGDHAEGAIEFDRERWRQLLDAAEERTPELLPMIRGLVADPDDYTLVREALTLVAPAEMQPSLEAWLRVHADADDYALVFRDLDREEEQFADESGMAKAGVLG